MNASNGMEQEDAFAEQTRRWVQFSGVQAAYFDLHELSKLGRPDEVCLAVHVFNPVLCGLKGD